MSQLNLAWGPQWRDLPLEGGKPLFKKSKGQDLLKCRCGIPFNFCDIRKCRDCGAPLCYRCCQYFRLPKDNFRSPFCKFCQKKAQREAFEPASQEQLERAYALCFEKLK